MSDFGKVDIGGTKFSGGEDHIDHTMQPDWVKRGEDILDWQPECMAVIYVWKCHGW